MQDAIKANARDYILKPINPDELTEILSRTVADLRKKEQTNNVIEEHNRNYKKREMRCLINEGKGTFIRLYGEDALAEINELYFGNLIASIDNFDNVSQKIMSDQRYLITQLLYEKVRDFKEHGVIFVRQQGMISVYFLSEKKNQVSVYQQDYINLIRSEVRKILPGQTIMALYSRIYKGIENLERAYDEARALYDQRYIYTVGSDIYYRRENLINNKKEEKPLTIESFLNVKQFVSCLMEWDKSGIDRELSEFQEKLHSSGGRSHLFLHVVLANIYGLLIDELNNLGIKTDDSVFDFQFEYQHITLLENVDDAIENLREFSYKIIDYLQHMNTHKHAKTISMAEKYIADHFQDHMLTMNDVANYVHMSPSYFSVLFKNEEGVSFSEYLIRIRVDQAKKLLQNTDLKAYEIAYAVGYDTAAYYSTAFKKVTGYSPSEYKKLFQKK